MDDDCDFLVRDNSCLLFQFDKNPFDLLRDQKYDDTEIKCSDYLMEAQSNEVETRSNSNSEKKSSPKHKNKEVTNRYMDFDESLKPKKRQKKIFGVVVKSEHLLDQVLDKTRKSSDPGSLEESEPVSFSKTHLMKLKRIKQKKLLEKTRGLKRQFSIEEESEMDSKKKTENISKKKKALQNRISAQKSIEKKKNIINQIKSEKDLLSNENDYLRFELERKNREIEQLRTLLSSQKDNTIPTTEKPNTYNFNFTVARTSTKIFGGLVACLILFTCLLQIAYYPSIMTADEPSNQIPDAIHNPVILHVKPRYSRKEIQQLTYMRDRLTLKPTHQNKPLNNTSWKGCVYKQYYFENRCGLENTQ